MTQSIDNQTTVIVKNNNGENSNVDVNEQAPPQQPAAPKKVQLDVEGAAFLEEVKEEEPVEEKKEETKAEGAKEPKRERKKEEGEEPVKKSKKKLFIILAIVLLLLAGGGVAAYFFLFSEDENALPEGVPPDAFIVTVEDKTYSEYYSTEVVTDDGKTVYSTTLEPFSIPLKNNGRTVLLECKFTLLTEKSELPRRLEAEKTKIRDAILYFLETKDYDFLTNYENYPMIKEQLLNVINKELIIGKYDEILFDNYVIK